VDVQAGLDLAVDLIEEVAEVDRPVLATACRSHCRWRCSGDGAVPDVVVAAPL
jgi:hypothetical protein